MTDYQTKSGLSVHPLLVDFVEKEALPGVAVTAEQFWDGFAEMVRRHVPTNARLLARRDELQGLVDDWHRRNGGVASDPAGYEQFLRDIGYLVAEPGDDGVGEELHLGGPRRGVGFDEQRAMIEADRTDVRGDLRTHGVVPPAEHATDLDPIRPAQRLHHRVERLGDRDGVGHGITVVTTSVTPCRRVGRIARIEGSGVSRRRRHHR